MEGEFRFRVLNQILLSYLVLIMMIIRCYCLYYLHFECPHYSHLANGLLSWIVIPNIIIIPIPTIIEHVCAHLSQFMQKV